MRAAVPFLLFDTALDDLKRALEHDLALDPRRPVIGDRDRVDPQALGGSRFLLDPFADLLFRRDQAEIGEILYDPR